jgi:flotillin
VNEAIQAGGESYFRYRQIEMLPQIAPSIADALAQAKLVTVANGETGAPETTTNNITSVIQTVLAAQLVSRGLLDGSAPSVPTASQATLPTSLSTPVITKK